MEKTTYVLITPARNEGDYIEKTIQSVVQQTILPQKWVIVSDNSTDRTDEIVRGYTQKYGFIQLIRVDDERDRSFGSKVRAFRKGYQEVKDLDFNYIGNLDADLSFGKEYYKTILKKFEDDQELGVAGGLRYEVGWGKCERSLNSSWCVTSGVQLFRRQCYEDIGGYTFEGIGEDTVAELVARWRGWKVRPFEEATVYHHKPDFDKTMGRLISEWFAFGEFEYQTGYHPLYVFVKFIYRIRDEPYFINTIIRSSGYFWALLRRKKLLLPEEAVAFQREEQMARITKVLGKR